MVFGIGATGVAYGLHAAGAPIITFPLSIVTILGSALAIFIAFRNNSSYSRWWEARTLWSSILTASRSLSRLVITLADSHAHQANYDRARSERFKRNLNNYICAWAHALRIHLRQQDTWEEIRKFLPEDEWQLLTRKEHKPNHILMLTGRRISDAMADGTLAGFDSFQMEGQLLALAQAQSGCERIKSTPLLRQYDYFTRLFLYTFLLLLPFALLSEIARMSSPLLLIPLSLVISFVFAIIGKVGEVNEDPFENRITDVPMTYVCNLIESNTSEMLGQPIPPMQLTNKDFVF
jgi:putative membrane protein